jgi:predicted nucleotidyltransferase
MDRTNQNNGQLRILQPFLKEPWKDFTLSEIKLLTKNKSHHYVYDALEDFSNIIKKEKRGNTNIYKINEESLEITPLLLAEIYNKKDFPKNPINQIKSKLKDSFYVLLITGSYAKNKQTKSSDLDVAIIIPNSSNKKQFEIALKEGELTIPEVHGFIFTEDEFYQMLINKEFNYGKECVKNHILIEGIETYYKILLKGLQNGFKG